MKYLHTHFIHKISYVRIITMMILNIIITEQSCNVNWITSHKSSSCGMHKTMHHLTESHTNSYIQLLTTSTSNLVMKYRDKSRVYLQYYNYYVTNMFYSIETSSLLLVTAAAKSKNIKLSNYRKF